MCLTPIHINNSTRRFVRGLSRPVLTVACGRCKECIKKMQNDWFVRCFFEYKRIEGKGAAWFPTLTFDREHLPIWTDKERNVSFPCFNTRLIKRFRDKLRVYLTREGYDAKDIRYIICPEFGSRRGRSHWHGLIFVPFEVPADVMKRVMQKAWTNGFVMWSKQGMMLNSNRGTQYVMKYVSKPDHWYKKYGIYDYAARLKREIKDCKDEDQKEDLREHYRAFRRACPRHVQSTYFGVTGLDYFHKSDGTPDIPRLVDGHINLTECGIVPDSKKPNYFYSMPDYYARKMFFFKDQYDLYQRNELAADVLSLRWSLMLEEKREKFAPYFSEASFRDHVSMFFSPEEYEVSNAYSLISGYMNGRTVDDLVLYDSVYRGLQMDDYWKSLDLPALHANAHDFMQAQRSVDVEPLPAPAKYTRYKHSPNSVEFSRHPAFIGFEDLLKFIEETEKTIGEAQQEAFADEVDRLQTLKEFNGLEQNFYV